MTDARLRTALRVILVQTIVCLGLAAACVFLWKNREPASWDPVPSKEELALRDPEKRLQAVEERVAVARGIWDTFADPAVGHLLLPRLKDRDVSGQYHVTSNSIGLRERDYAMPKPSNQLRVVLLGDSYVMGCSVEKEDRLGVFLEKWLRERSKAGHRPIEVLHLGVNTWNIVAEATFLRRQLSLLKPDPVIHLSVRNDIEDNVSARGFGELSNFNPLHPERGDDVFQTKFPCLEFRTRQNNLIGYGLDWESRHRYEEQREAIDELVKELDAASCPYVLIDYYMGLLPVSRRFLMRNLRPEQVAHLPSALLAEDRYRVSQEDAHWSRAGHELVAKMIYSLIQRRKLLQDELASWPEADEVADDWLARGDQEAAAEPELDQAPRGRAIDRAIDFFSLDDAHAAQVHGGVFAGNLVGPYAAVVLRDDGCRTLKVRGEPLGRHELEGTRVEVLVEEASVGTITLAGKGYFEQTFEIPEEIAKRRFVSVRLRSSNWAYALPDLRKHVVFHLRSLALE